MRVCDEMDTVDVSVGGYVDTVEVTTMGRKATRVMRSLEEEPSIAEEALRPGALVAAVPRRHGVPHRTVRRLRA